MADTGLEFLFQRINYERRTTLPYDEQRMKLANMQALLERMGNPQSAFPIIHIAGTKGKGSVTAMIASILSSSGYRVGTYTSPHLRNLTERFCVNGKECSHESLIGLIDRIQPVVETIDQQAATGGEIAPPTFFEITTAIAFQFFADQKVDFAVIETGLGGRLDSTNVCQPVLSVITTISFDHTKQLGNTLREIANEKAGIIKSGITVVSGVTDLEPRDKIRQVAGDRVSSLIELDREFTIRTPSVSDHSGSHQNLIDSPVSDGFLSDGFHFPTPAEFDFELTEELARLPGIENVKLSELQGLRSGLVGKHQQLNAAVAICSALMLVAEDNSRSAITAQTIRDGIANTVIPGRIELLQQKPAVICDVAHNPASAKALIDTIGESLANLRGGTARLIYATSRDKDHQKVLQVLLPYFSDVCFTKFLENPRARNPQELLQAALNIESERNAGAVDTGAVDAEKRLSAIDDPSEAWREVNRRSNALDAICIMGSAFIVAELRDLVNEKPSDD